MKRGVFSSTPLQVGDKVTLSRSFFFLKSLMSALICSIISHLVPIREQ